MLHSSPTHQIASVILTHSYFSSFTSMTQYLDTGNYTCLVENVHGRDDVTYSVEVKVPPQPPVLAVVDSYADSLHLQWSDQGDGGSPILGKYVSYHELQVRDSYLLELLRHPCPLSKFLSLHCQYLISTYLPFPFDLLVFQFHIFSVRIGLHYCSYIEPTRSCQMSKTGASWFNII